MRPIVMIKYGKKEHLKQLVNGIIRFAPTEDYINLEKITGEKGQGDLDEGKLYVNSICSIMQSYNNPNEVSISQNVNFKFTFNEINYRPVFCLSQYFEEDITDCSTLNISKDKVDAIIHDFPEATHALIIKEPEKFIDDLSKISISMCSNEIQYFDYTQNWINMYAFVASEEKTNNGSKIKYRFTANNIYRQLYCKSDKFKKQQEYRFILKDWIINKPIFLSISFTSKYEIVPIKKLYKKIML